MCRHGSGCIAAKATDTIATHQTRCGTAWCGELTGAAIGQVDGVGHPTGSIGVRAGKPVDGQQRKVTTETPANRQLPPDARHRRRGAAHLCPIKDLLAVLGIGRCGLEVALGGAGGDHGDG